MESFLTELKKVASVIPLPQETAAELKKIIDKFAFSYTFFKKYQTIFDQLELQDT